ncbi:UNVERIFIED_CONTAM: hypothetical protein FKN15_026525 [Acipenser sinensis]
MGRVCLTLTATVHGDGARPRRTQGLRPSAAGLGNRNGAPDRLLPAPRSLYRMLFFHFSFFSYSCEHAVTFSHSSTDCGSLRGSSLHRGLLHFSWSRSSGWGYRSLSRRFLFLSSPSLPGCLAIASGSTSRGSFQSVCSPPAAQQLFDNIDDSFWTLREAVSRLKDHLEGFWKVELMKATIAVDMTLDRDTAHSYLILSEDGKQVRCGDKPQPLPDNTKRFYKKSYVLGREGFTSGRHYWEVKVGEKIRWVLGVTRESSQRKGGITEKPQQGFRVIWWNEENNLFSAVRAPRTPLPLSPKPRKLGVYLDYEGGHLSFYNVETRSHIYTFTDTFTEKLYPLFSPGLYSSGKNAAPLIICPHTYTD